MPQKCETFQVGCGQRRCFNLPNREIHSKPLAPPGHTAIRNTQSPPWLTLCMHSEQCGCIYPPSAPRQYPRIYYSSCPGSGKGNPRSRLDRQGHKPIAVPAEINSIGARPLSGTTVPFGPTGTGNGPLTVSGWPLRSPAQGLRWAGYRGIGRILPSLGQWSTRRPAEACKLLYSLSKSTGRDLLFRLRSAGIGLGSLSRVPCALPPSQCAGIIW